jgi:hypothetical protein
MSSKGLNREQLKYVFSPTGIRSLLDSTISFDVIKAMKKACRWKDYVCRFDPLFVQFFMMMTEAPKLKSNEVTDMGITREQVSRLYQVCVSQLNPSQLKCLGCTTTLPDHSTIGGYVFGRVLQLHYIIHNTWRPPPLPPAATAPTTATATTATTPPLQFQDNLKEAYFL